VVDREPGATNAIRDTLAGEGFVVQVAHDARQAVDLIDRSRPDAIVLDVLLPDQSSLDVLEALRREKAVSLPPVLLTARPGGAEALDLAANEKPDLVLVDVMMPEMDGWEVLKLLRVDPETAHIPVAMLSARTEAKDRVQGLQEGAVDYICKPFALPDLLGKIE